MATDSKSLFDVAMELRVTDVPNIRQTVPFFNVKDIEASLRFYVDGLGFTITRYWDPDGRMRWCWLELGLAAVMLQEYWKDGRPAPTAVTRTPSVHSRTAREDTGGHRPYRWFRPWTEDPRRPGNATGTCRSASPTR
jgi:catechol 2,3-dioxygenase-like lactoylglutathione lyase family enzyme